MTDVVALAESLIAQPSLTDEEAPAVELATAWLRDRGWNVTLQPVSVGRANIWASRGLGSVTLSTHLDTVPPFIGPGRSGNHLTGRGACDAKGIAAAMVAAAQTLVEEGEERVDLLLVVGEESAPTAHVPPIAFRRRAAISSTASLPRDASPRALGIRGGPSSFLRRPSRRSTFT